MEDDETKEATVSMVRISAVCALQKSILEQAKRLAAGGAWEASRKDARELECMLSALETLSEEVP